MGLPLAQVGGRALFNVIAGVYFLWGLIALIGSRVTVKRPILVLYVLLITAMAMSAFGAVDSERALRKTAEFLAHSMAFFFTLMVLQTGLSRVEKLVKTYAIACAALVIVLYLQLLYLMPGVPFEPTLVMKEDNLPFLTPMLLYFVYVSVANLRVRHLVIIAVMVVIAIYVGMSEGRAALLGLVVAGYGTILLALRRRWYEAALVGMVLVLITMLAGSLSFDRHAFDDVEIRGESWSERIDRFSSYRISLWKQAMDNPPKNTLLGVGMGNARYVDVVMETRYGTQMRHLHNFVLDAWYETGAVGVTLLIALLLLLFRAGYLAFKKLKPPHEQYAGIFLSSGTAILAAGLLSFSYGSRQFSLYLFVILAGAYALYQRAEAPD